MVMRAALGVFLSCGLLILSSCRSPRVTVPAGPPDASAEVIAVGQAPAPRELAASLSLSEGSLPQGGLSPAVAMPEEAPGDTPGDVVDENVVESNGAPQPPAPGPQQAPSSPPAPGGAAIKTDAAIEADRRRFLVQRYLEQAREAIRTGAYDDAAGLLNQALQLDPINRNVRFELHQLEILRGSRGSTARGYADERGRVVRLRVDEQRTKVASLTNVGRMHLANQRYDSAIEAFEDALFIINTSPYAVDWGTLEREATDGLRQAQMAREQTAQQERREAIEQSLDQLARAQEQELMQEMERLAQWMGAAIEAFERNEFDLAEEYAGRVLEEQPDHLKAQELAKAARDARHSHREVEYLRREKIAFRAWLDQISVDRIPQQSILEWPSRSFWDRVSAARAQTRPSIGAIAEDPEAAELLKKVEAATVSISVKEERPFQEVVNTLRVQTGFNIVIDPRLAASLGEAVVSNLILEDAALPTVLNMLQNQGGEGTVWTTRGNVVLFTSREHLQRNVVVQVHSVSDLTAGLTTFIPPTIELVNPDDLTEERPLFGAEAEDPVLPYGTADELVELIRNAVSPTYWEDEANGTITPQGENLLVVKATPEVQDQVASFLNALRGFAGIVVTVESRFLEVGENFLRDVGVDFRGLGGATAGMGTLVNLDDVTNGLEDNASAGFDNGGTGVESLNPSAGAFFNDGQDGDFRGRTENIFDNPLGRVLSSVGGGTLTWSYIDDAEVNMILRATEKTLSSRTLTAPIITVYNTQRANITMVNQLSYVRDFDVEVAQTSHIADPIVGIIQDGLTLDVRPTVSHDRRYITLELQPTVARLRRPIPTFSTTLASTFAPVVIQLPELRIQQARTTVRMPDQGTILIGGLTEIRTVDRMSETPILGELPLLTFLFSRKGRSDEVGDLLILVNAAVTDLAAQEDRLMRN